MSEYSYLLLILFITLSFYIRVDKPYFSAIMALAFVIFWSVTARLSPPSADVTSYNTVMSGEYSFTVLGLLNEPVLWAFQQGVYYFTESIFTTWIIGDVLILGLLYFCIKRLGTGLGITDKRASDLIST